MPAHVALGALDVARLGNHVEVALALQQQPQTAAHDGVIVGQHDADLLLCAGFSLRCALFRLLSLFCHVRDASACARRLCVTSLFFSPISVGVWRVPHEAAYIPSPGRNSLVNGGRPAVLGSEWISPCVNIQCPNAAHADGSCQP